MRTPRPSTTETLDPSSVGHGGRAIVPRPFLVLAFDPFDPLSGGARFELHETDEVLIARDDATRAARSGGTGGRTLRIGVGAPTLSRRHARIAREGSAWSIEDLGSRNGTRVGGTEVTRSKLEDGDLIELGGVFFVFRPRWLAPGDAGDLDGERVARSPNGLRTFIPELDASFAALRRLAESDISLVVLGETGTGKELLARAIHAQSGRRGRLVAVNCGALPQELVESTLFGHRRGAFSGAVRDEPGLVRAADGGTLFLDEIGELPITAQAALLRVLQEREVTAVGATEPQRVDFRVISATHRPVHDLARSGAFRPDLLARLSGAVTELPPLRNRREDLGLIVADILRTLDARCTFSVSAARRLFSYAWPGNARELAQTLKAAVVLAESGRIELPVPRSESEPPDAGPGQSMTPPAGRVTREQLVRLLAENDGNVAAVARALAKAPIQIRRWMTAFGLSPDEFRNRS